MRLGRTVASSSPASEYRKPLGPVTAELEKVVVVREPESFELLEQGHECLGVVDWTDRYDVAHHTELLGREAQPLIERGTHEPGPLVRRPSDEQSGCARVYLKWHLVLKISGEGNFSA